MPIRWTEHRHAEPDKGTSPCLYTELTKNTTASSGKISLEQPCVVLGEKKSIEKEREREKIKIKCYSSTTIYVVTHVQFVSKFGLFSYTKKHV